MKFSDLTAALGLTPKTLTEARGTLDASKATLASVVEMFSVAGLDLDTLLAAGPDALKAHLDALAADDDTLAEVLLECERLETELATSAAAALQASAQLSTFGELFATLGVADLATAPTAEALQKSFSDHVAKQVTLALAKTGHPPVQHIDATAPAGENTADADEAHLVAYEALSASGDRAKRFAYYDAHTAELIRANARRQARTTE
jgi:hypothetical protein